MSFTPNDIFNLVKATLQDSKLNADVFLSACKHIISLMYDKYSWNFFNSIDDTTLGVANQNYVELSAELQSKFKKANALFFDEMIPENRKIRSNKNFFLSLLNQTDNVIYYNDTIIKGRIYFDTILKGNEKIIILYKQTLDLTSFTITSDNPFPDDFLQVFTNGVIWQLCPFSREPQSQNAVWFNYRDAFKEGLNLKIKDYEINDDFVETNSLANVQNEFNYMVGGV